MSNSELEHRPTERRASHTPGPWHVYERNSLCIESAAGNIALVNLARASEADARLIAAAPDLLKLAREYAGACINCGGSAEIIRNKSSDGDPLHDFAEPCPECEHIQDVIAKATGEHS